MPHSGTSSLLIRADATVPMGTGHVMRSLALAQAWQRCGGEVGLASRELPPALEDRLSSGGIAISRIDAEAGSLQDADQTAALAHRMGARWVVADGYQFPAAWHDAVRSGRSLCCLDDFGSAQNADLIVNQNLHAAASLYRKAPPDTTLLLGGRYALLRHEFLEASPSSMPADSSRGPRILVSCGGSDPAGATSIVLRGLSQIPSSLEVIAVVGPGNPRRGELERLAMKLGVPVTLEHNSGRMAALMRWADLAVVAAGSTCWELAYLGVPMLALIAADNQVPVAASVESHGLGQSLGWATDLTAERVAASVARLIGEAASREPRGERHIDGLGAERVARLMMAPRLRLRPAAFDDCRRLWEWRNDPVVRQASFSSDSIPYDTHVSWLARQLARPDVRIWIVEDAEGHPVGQVRFHLVGPLAEISVSVDSGSRAAGIGTALIRLATETMLGRQAVQAVDAWVKEDNRRSQRAFEKAGYRLAETDPDRSALRYRSGLFESPALSNGKNRQIA